MPKWRREDRSGSGRVGGNVRGYHDQNCTCKRTDNKGDSHPDIPPHYIETIDQKGIPQESLSAIRDELDDGARCVESGDRKGRVRIQKSIEYPLDIVSDMQSTEAKHGKSDHDHGGVYPPFLPPVKKNDSGDSIET